MAEIDKFIIMEDDIPRDGGRYPEYTYTFLIGLQSFAGGIARGYVKSFHVEKLLFFPGARPDDLHYGRYNGCSGCPHERESTPESGLQTRINGRSAGPFVDLRGK